MWLGLVLWFFMKKLLHSHHIPFAIHESWKVQCHGNFSTDSQVFLYDVSVWFQNNPWWSSPFANFFFWQFSMWTDAQRKKFLTFILKRCTKSQLRFVNEGWFQKQLPILHLDFTTVLPQFISTYIFSFLDPRSLCRAAQVSWHWKFVCEQDVIWMPKCLRYGWYLPYTPSSREFGCWKHHYIMCTSSLDMEAPSRMVSFFLIWYVTNNRYVRQCAWHIYTHLYIHCRPLKVCSFHFRRQRIMVNLLTTALELLKERSNKKQMKRGRSEKQSITEKVYRDINCNLTL